MTIAALIYALIYALIFIIVLGLVWWAGSAVITLLPAPLQQVARVVLIVLLALLCIAGLLSLVGGGLPLHRLG